MSKYQDYAALGDYLASLDASAIPMTFSEIERLIGRPLPKSAKYPAWWSNNPSNNAMTEVWLNAGFKTEQVDITGRKLVFHRASPDQPRGAGLADVGRSYARPPAAPGDIGDACRHPLYGALKGYIRNVPALDLTEPADPEWGQRVWGRDST